ncbi:MAG: dual specificity protein phosphatase family protein [Ilumatobacteraceae bacterium]
MSNANDDGLGWLGSRGRDGGIDRVPLPGVAGAMSLCGKHAIGRDPDAAVRQCGATVVICLVEEHELLDRYPEYVTWLRSRTRVVGAGEQRDTHAVWMPVHDMHAPSLDDAMSLLADMLTRVRGGEHLLVHCGAGIGRAGTIAACLLVALGMDEDTALDHLARHRPMAGPEVGAQRDLVRSVASEFRAGAG